MNNMPDNSLSPNTSVSENNTALPQPAIAIGPYDNPGTAITAEPPRTYTMLECVIAWLSLAIGYIFCRVFPVTENPLGGFIFVLTLFISALVFCKIKAVKVSTTPLIAAASAIVVSLSLIFSANPFLSFFAYIYALAVFCYFIYAVTGNSVKKGFSNLITVDFIKALFVLPFYSLGSIFKAMFSNKKGSKLTGKILLGVALAIIPTAVVLSLLSYDSGFSKLLSNIFDFNFGNIFSHIGSLILGIPIGMYIFGLFISSVDKKGNDIFTEKACHSLLTKVRIAPTVTVISAVIPMLFVYVIFFISQWEYYISGFTGVLPEAFSYAEYAREGFFQLCTVSVINLIIIVAVVLFLRRQSDKTPLLLKALTVIFSVFTLILISTSIAKMVMYIDCYGLTQKRVYATWFMAVLSLAFIIIAVKQFAKRLNAVAMILSICVTLFAALSLCNVDGFIAKYNVDRYIAGSLETVDIYAMGELGDAAIPELVRLENELEERQFSNTATDEENDLYLILNNRLNRESDRFENLNDNVFSFNIPFSRAKNTLNSR